MKILEVRTPGFPEFTVLAGPLAVDIEEVAEDIEEDKKRGSYLWALPVLLIVAVLLLVLKGR